ncbi:hypothetical protein AAG570_007869 [Ranatra chinensis]|uniref:Uncharacterized protein n=1 Tax=Ranatra chinensis TaxID=642074 RepID=A0ABD0XT38_9HEMI
MLSRKNKDLRTVKEGVVGKYVKKETPPEMPIINVWSTEPLKKPNKRIGQSSESNTTSPGQSSISQKFSNMRVSQSPTLLGHEGKYTPNTSMPAIAQRFASLSLASNEGNMGVSSPSLFNSSVPSNLISSVNHTYMGQYTGSQYNIDKTQVFYFLKSSKFFL